MEVYPRPTFKANIARFLGMNPPPIEVAINEDELVAAANSLMTMSSGVV
jgi:hypothetical protein